MLSMSRHSEIIEVLDEEGFASVSDLAKRFDVSIATIRRDLERLEQLDLVQRTHGGALPLKQASAPPTYIKDSLHAREKAAIGRAMAERILDGQTVLLDSGTTTLQVAKNLGEHVRTVVTNDLRIANEIALHRNTHLVMIGGELLPQEFSMWGPAAIQQIEHLRVDVAVFGADSVNERGIFNNASYLVELKRAMRAISQQAFFVADSSKFGREALFQVLDFDAFTAGISDDMLDPIRAASFPVPIIVSRVAR